MKPLQRTDVLSELAARQRSRHRLQQPVAIIGPRDATEVQIEAAYRIAFALACAGVSLVCGGKIGVMEAAARAAQDAGGICIGLLPEDEASFASPFLTVALPTGMGLSRNMLVARTAVCLVAVGGSLGTVSEMAMGLQWGKPVFAMQGAPDLPGAQGFADESALVEAASRWLLNHQMPSGQTDLGG